MKQSTIKASELLPRTNRKDKEYRLAYYDFRRPDKLSKEQIRTIAVVYETFGRLGEVVLSARMREQVKVHLNSVDQVCFGEFVSSLESPTIMGIVNYKPLICSTMMELSPEITIAFCDRLLGGRGTEQNFNRELSSIGYELVRDLFSRLLMSLKESWKSILDITPEIGGMEHNPLFMQIVPPSEMVITITLDIEMGECRGHLTFCLPYLTMEPVMHRLSWRWYNEQKKAGPSEMVEKTLSLNLDTVLIHEAGSVNLKTLGLLKKGSLLPLESFKKGEAYVRMGGIPLLYGKFKKEKGCLLLIIPKQFKRIVNRNTAVGNRPDKLAEELTRLTAKLDRTSDLFMKKIDQLKDGQDYLNNQLLLGRPENKLALQKSAGLDTIGMDQIPNLYLILQDDFLQLSALVLSRLSTDPAARLLELFPMTKQVELLQRISLTNRVAPKTLMLIEKVLLLKLEQMGTDLETDRDGTRIAAEILNHTGRTVEKTIIEFLERTESELAERLKERMFVFEDIVLLDNDSFERMYERVDKDDFCKQLKVIPSSVEAEILSRLKSDEREEMKNRKNKMGRMRINDVDDAARRIIRIIQEMEENGEAYLN